MSFNYQKVTDEVDVEKNIPNKFESRANKNFGRSFAKDAEKTSVDIMPSPFPTITNIVEKDVINGLISDITIKKKFNSSKFYTITDTMEESHYDLSRPALLLFAYIGYNLLWNSNYISITEKEFSKKTKYDRDSFNRAIQELIKHKILAKTTRKSLYIVNHNLIFRGNLMKFIGIYQRKYPTPALIDDKGRVIINK